MRLAIDKSQRSRLTFLLRSLVSDPKQIFSQTIWPIKLKFDLKTGMKIYVNVFGHMTKVAAMPLCGNNLLGNQNGNDLGMWGLPKIACEHDQEICS